MSVSQLLTLRIINHLGEYVTEHKREFINKVLDQRTRHVTVVMEDIYQSQNASAVLRTCECYGLQDVHIIEHENTYALNKRVLKGANKWLHIHQHRAEKVNNTEACFQKLWKDGYKILATVPDPTVPSIEEIDLNDKIALVMGNELHGLSAFAKEHADMKVRIPMYGFTESLNLSVSTAICLNQLIPKLRRSAINWHLSEEDQLTIKLEWYRKIVRHAEVIERKFLESIK